MTHKLLYIAPHRPGRSPGQRFRFEQYTDCLSAAGFSITYSYLLNQWDDRHFYHHGNYTAKLWIAIKGLIIRMFDVIRASRFDYVLVYREAHFFGMAFFERLIAKRTVMLFDFDDAIWLNDTSDSNKNLSWLKNAGKTAAIVRTSALTIVGNDFLAAPPRQWSRNVIVIPTTIDTNTYSYRKPKEREPVVVGWIGSLTTLRHFKQAIPFLTDIKNKYGDKVIYKVIVDVDYREPALGIVSTKWNQLTEVEELANIDIGIMPLPDDDWSRGKCGFKGIQYMSLGIATVMSPVGVNTSIISHGQNGMLAQTRQEWTDCLSQLIESAPLRRKLGLAGRQTIEERYSVKSQQQHLVNAFVIAAKNKNKPI